MKQVLQDHFEDFVNRKHSESDAPEFQPRLSRSRRTGPACNWSGSGKGDDGDRLQAMARLTCNDRGRLGGEGQNDGQQFMDGRGCCNGTANRIPRIRLMAICQQEDRGEVGHQIRVRPTDGHD